MIPLRRIPGMLGLTAVLLSAFSTAPALANDQLLNKIDAAQKRLNVTEQRVSRERQSMARELNALERDVRQLQDETAVARRLADEKTLSLSQLEERLDGWRQQQVYQRNLLHRFLQQQGAESSPSTNTSEQIARVVDFSNRIEGLFFPAWQMSEITLRGGSIETLPTLTVGPITWFWDGEDGRAGLASEQGQGRLRADLRLKGGASDAIEQLRDSGQGELVFDPTLSRALAKEQHAESLLEHLMKGGLWVVPILFFALFALSIALVKVVQLWRLPGVVRFTPGALETLLRDSNSPIAETVRGMQKTLLDIGQNAETARQCDDQLFMQLQDDRHYLDRWIGAIAITASVSPLLGLLGTVSGMIETFKMMTLFGSGDPEVVSGGIAQALVTTELGLVVAIPALILNAVLSRRAKSYYNDLESFAILLSKAGETTKGDADD